MVDEPVQDPTPEKPLPRPSFLAQLRDWVFSNGGKDVEVQEESSKVGIDFISKVLPHQGRWRLIDSAVITPTKVTGFFTMTAEVCEGHGIGGNLVSPAALLPEMANQLLGIWYATQHPELIGAGKILFARKGDYKASKFIRPGDLVQIEVAYADLWGSVTTNRRGTFMELGGKNFVITVAGELKGTVESVELKGVEGPKIAPKT